MDIVKRIRQQSYFGLEPYEAADEIETLRQRVAEWKEVAEENLKGMAICKQRVAELEKDCDGHVEEIKLLKQQIDELLSKKFTRFANYECWIYQGDGEDHLESLVCPVVISASQLLQIEKQRDELLAAAEAIEINAEECLDFDECTAMLVPIDTYHKLMEAIASVKEG